jgi:hypothetical protein
VDLYTDSILLKQCKEVFESVKLTNCAFVSIEQSPHEIVTIVKNTISKLDVAQLQEEFVFSDAEGLYTSYMSSSIDH